MPKEYYKIYKAFHNVSPRSHTHPARPLPAVSSLRNVKIIMVVSRPNADFSQPKQRPNILPPLPYFLDKKLVKSRYGGNKHKSMRSTPHP